MHYLIDGHNLIGQLTDIELGEPNDEVKLVLMLRSWAAAGNNKRQITLYFDGGAPGGKAPELSQGSIKVIFASSGRQADDLLIYHVRRASHPAGYTLVTGDRQIISWAKKRRMPVMTSETFARRLEKEQETRREAMEPDDGEDPVVSAGEVEEWLTLFGPVPETAPPPRPARRRQRPAAPKQPRAPRDPKELKSSGDLTEDELSDWLELFNFSDDE